VVETTGFNTVPLRGTWNPEGLCRKGGDFNVFGVRVKFLILCPPANIDGVVKSPGQRHSGLDPENLHLSENTGFRVKPGMT